MLNITKQIAVNGIMSVGMMLAIIAKGVDLSIGSMLALVCAVAGSFIGIGAPAWAVLLICLALGAACGFLNGFLIVKLRVMPIIVTLGTMNIFRGIAYVYSGGKWTTNLPKDFLVMGKRFRAGGHPCGGHHPLRDHYEVYEVRPVCLCDRQQ